MRIPHYLIRSPSGIYTFRLIVPRHLREPLRRRVIKRSLHTRDLVTARASALSLFVMFRDAVRGPSMGKTLEELLASAQGKRVDYEITPTAYGLSIKADGPADHALAMQALERMQASPAPRIQSSQSSAKTIPLGEARKLWLASIKNSTLTKTYTIKASAIDALVTYVGANQDTASIQRPELSGFFQSLRDKGLSSPTIVNKSSYLRGFFDWCRAAGYYPHENPTVGQVKYSVREKRQRKKYGFKAFTTEQVQALFSPAAFEGLSYYARWASIICLYTGGRVSEVGQLLTKDVLREDGIDCIRITDEGEDQQTKTESSNRIVPIHADLLAMGFIDYVRSVEGARLFPNAGSGAINGAGNWITKAFSLHVSKVGGGWDKAKRGAHSLRKTFIQEMQTNGIPSELRAQLTGHEIDDEHHSTYSRTFTAKEKLNGLKLNYGLDLPALRSLLASPARTRTQKGPKRKPSA